VVNKKERAEMVDLNHAGALPWAVIVHTQRRK
jgi:hypothetical protein